MKVSQLDQNQSNLLDHYFKIRKGVFVHIVCNVDDQVKSLEGVHLKSDLNQNLIANNQDLCNQ